jgi:hypothetical protein
MTARPLFRCQFLLRRIVRDAMTTIAGVVVRRPVAQAVRGVRRTVRRAAARLMVAVRAVIGNMNTSEKTTIAI